MKHITPHPKALEALTYLATRGMNLTFYCDKGSNISAKGQCVCGCENSRQKQARKVKVNKLKEYGLFFTKNYKATK